MGFYRACRAYSEKVKGKEEWRGCVTIDFGHAKQVWPCGVSEKSSIEAYRWAEDARKWCNSFDRVQNGHVHWPLEDLARPIG